MDEFSPDLHGNRVVELAQQLRTQRATRQKSQTFFVEGVRNFLMALDNGWAIHAVIFSKRLLTSGIARSKVRALRRSGIHTFSVTPEQFRALSGSLRASGIAAIIHQRYGELSQGEGVARYVAVESVQSLGNFGSLIRTAVASGTSGLVLVGRHVDPFDERVIHGSMGAILSTKVIRTTLKDLASWVRRSDGVIVGACADGELPCFDYQHPRRCVLALGHERTGLSDEFRNLCAKTVRIPMETGVDSLNIAVAAGILLYCGLQSSKCV